MANAAAKKSAAGSFSTFVHRAVASRPMILTVCLVSGFTLSFRCINPATTFSDEIMMI
jgi:hypothetical protein